MKKVLIAILCFVLAVLLLAGGLLVYGDAYAKNYKNPAPEQVELEANEFNTITAVGRGLYDSNGKRFDIKGTNFGNLFIFEGWMTINSIGALTEGNNYTSLNSDKRYVEGYKEIYQEEMDAILAERFTDEQIATLNDAYFESYCTEADFEIIKEIGLNTIRLPLYYRTFLTTHDRYRLTDEELCAMNFDEIELDFEKVDKFLEYAEAKGLKVILDMHGVMGGQSGYEHCGTKDIDFWTNEDYIEFMCNLWKAIAKHYVTERSDLASTILAYDLANEPTNRNEIGTGPLQWEVMDRLYDAIREVDTHHVISIEGVWYPVSLPSPEKYGWENVIYQYHFYNWNHDSLVPNELFYALQFGLYSLSDFDVPKFVGEFSFFGNDAAWEYYLDQYDQLGWGWTTWSYKTISVGFWDSTWGIVVQKLHLENEPGVLTDGDFSNDKLKLDLNTASYEEILEKWSNEYTIYGDQEGVYTFIDKVEQDGTVKYGQMYSILKAYFERTGK